MIKINLLPKEFEKKPVVQELDFIVFVAIGLVVGILISLYLLKNIELIKQTKKLKNIEQELATLSEITAQVDLLESQKTSLNQKLGVVREVVQGRLLYSHFLEDLVKQVSSYMWLTSVSCEDKGPYTLNLNIQAVASDNYIVADFIKSLLDTPKFSNVELGSISSLKLEKVVYRSFSVTCSYTAESE